MINWSLVISIAFVVLFETYSPISFSKLLFISATLWLTSSGFTFEKSKSLKTLVKFSNNVEPGWFSKASRSSATVTFDKSSVCKKSFNAISIDCLFKSNFNCESWYNLGNASSKELIVSSKYSDTNISSE